MDTVPDGYIPVHWGYINGGKEEGFRYSRGNPAVKSQTRPVQFNLVNPIFISGFIKYLYIKKANTCEHIRLMGLRLTNLSSLAVLAQTWHEKSITCFMANQPKYSLYFTQYEQSTGLTMRVEE